MKKLVFAVLLASFPLSSEGQTLGCFVDFNFPSICSASTLTCGTSNSANFSAFGYTVGSLCADFNSAKTLLNQCTGAFIETEEQRQSCVSNLNAAISQRDSCLNTYNAMEANRLEWVTYGQYQARLAKRLKRACGSPCKRIR